MTSERHTVEHDLHEALGGAGCALCALLARSVRRAIDALTYEGVTDVDVRAEIRAARGLCATHGVALRQARQAFGAAGDVVQGDGGVHGRDDAGVVPAARGAAEVTWPRAAPGATVATATRAFAHGRREGTWLTTGTAGCTAPRAATTGWPASG